MIYEAHSKTGPPGGSPLDFFPLLQHFPPWFPGAKHHLEEDEKEEDLKDTAATMFAAGESTTWSALTIFILAMILHPEIQAKAQQEIDSVVGDLCLPELKDRVDLPFVKSILQETFRLTRAIAMLAKLSSDRPFAREGVPHRAMENDVYSVSTISVLVPVPRLKCWSKRNGSRRKRVLQSFTLNGSSLNQLEPGSPTSTNQVFVFGRRICTAQYVADNSLWIAIASILATCTITNAVDESGEIIVPESTLTDGLVRQVMMRSASRSDDLVQR
ncbi:cytochrome P450 [Mycena olivaceomarginata]|nr:cytochrome P450 [Mycena olivaceomarginata]